GAPVRLALAPPPALPAPVAAAPAPPPGSPRQPSPAAPVRQPAPEGRSRVLLAVAALLLLILAAAAARWMRGGKAAAPPPAPVSVRLRAEVQPRASVQGAPFGDARLRMRVRSGAPAARVAALGPLFARKEVAGD
ncbi:MAG TPA: hypothetical protein VFR37_03500, partial [Longimicrobium sp.]|nr:hypothetical protein [Longimicrobium sp.]